MQWTVTGGLNKGTSFLLHPPALSIWAFLALPVAVGCYCCSDCLWFGLEVFCGLVCFWPFPFPYSFSQHMVLIMCWKSRQAAGQTAMSPTESSKSSTTSKVSTTLQIQLSSFHPACGDPSVGASPNTICHLVARLYTDSKGKPLLGLRIVVGILHWSLWLGLSFGQLMSPSGRQKFQL